MSVETKPTTQQAIISVITVVQPNIKYTDLVKLVNELSVSLEFLRDLQIEEEENAPSDK